MKPEYGPLLVLFCVIGVVVAAMVTLSTVLGPKRHRAAKYDVFECGSRPVGSPRQRTAVKFHLVALLFLLFDVEAVFLFPWAVVFLSPALSSAVFYAMMIFIGILLFGLFYCWKKGLLQWK